jgi:hypothetical protein
MAKNNKKLEATARRLAAIAERHLSQLPEEEQEARVAAFARVKFTNDRDGRAKPSSPRHTQTCPAVARGCE